ALHFPTAARFPPRTLPSPCNDSWIPRCTPRPETHSVPEAAPSPPKSLRLTRSPLLFPHLLPDWSAFSIRLRSCPRILPRRKRLCSGHFWLRNTERDQACSCAAIPTTGKKIS